MHLHPSSLEVLEARIAPATFAALALGDLPGPQRLISFSTAEGVPQPADAIPPNITISPDGKVATYTEPDSDLVKITVSKGRLAVNDFIFSGDLLAEINLSDDIVDGVPEFGGADLRVVAKVPEGSSSAGRVAVGYLNATNIDLGHVQIDGNLGRIDVGDENGGKALKTLAVESFGRAGTPGELLASRINGKLRSFATETNVDGVALDITGSVGSIGKVGGKLTFSGGLQIGGACEESIIRSGGIISKLTATGVDDSRVSALGNVFPTTKVKALAFGKITVDGAVSNSSFLAGYNFENIAQLDDSSIGTVLVTGAWTASNLVAAVADVTDDGFGRNDEVIPTGNPDIVARIASVTIIGTATGSATPDDHFGITAQQIDRATINGPLLLSENEKDNFSLGASGDFRLVEV